MSTEAPTPAIIREDHAPKEAPCPHCGKEGRRKRKRTRRVRTLLFKRVAYREITYGESTARCGCCTTFHSGPDDVAPKALYDDSVRRLVLDRILRHGLNVLLTLRMIADDFLLPLSVGYVYSVLAAQARQLDMASHRRRVLEHFSGTLCVDEVHLSPGRVLLVATDPEADLVVAVASVSSNDQAHMRRFLKNLAAWGLRPEAVISDGSSLYPKVLAEVWPEAMHQLCLFHVIRDLNKKVHEGIRRVRRDLAARGRRGRKKKRGPKPKGRRSKPSGGPPRTQKERSVYLFRRRFLFLRRPEGLSRSERQELAMMITWSPELATLRRFVVKTYAMFDAETPRQAWGRRAALLRDPRYGQLPELAEALGMLGEETFAKVMAYLARPADRRVRTNNHVERTNRTLRRLEEARYCWRGLKALMRFLMMKLDVVWSERLAELDGIVDRWASDEPPSRQSHREAA
jgi:hypothetical protein